MAHWLSNSTIKNWLAQHLTRGAAVPFETPALRMARVYDDERDGLTAILRDFAMSGASYVVPWRSLPLMVTMTDHDKAVHHAIGDSRAATPQQVRAVVTKLALSGALGEPAKAREQAATEADNTRLADAELILILHLLRSCGVELTSLLPEPGRWCESKAKAGLATAANVAGIKRQDIYPRVAEFARLLAPVGLVATTGTIQTGWLRALYNEISGFSRGEALTTMRDPPDAVPYVQAIITSAQRATDICGWVLGIIDYAVLDIAGTIKRWPREQPALRLAIERLSLMLDEWPSFMKLVHDALRASPETIVGELKVLRHVLPQVPESGPAEPGGGKPVPSASDVLASRLSDLWPTIRAPQNG